MRVLVKEVSHLTTAEQGWDNVSLPILLAQRLSFHLQTRACAWEVQEVELLEEGSLLGNL